MVDIRPSSIPNLSLITLARGARQLVVHDALLVHKVHGCMGIIHKNCLKEHNNSLVDYPLSKLYYVKLENACQGASKSRDLESKGTNVKS